MPHCAHPIRVCAAVALLLVVSCGGSSGGGSSSNVSASPSPSVSPSLSPEPAGDIALSMSLSRVASSGLDLVSVTVNVSRDDLPVVDASFSPSVEAGSVSSVVNNLDGSYTFTLSAGKTGEYPISITVEDVTVSKTALVLQDVHPDWSQPQAVEGLVNTAGYEDGVTITPDGEYLFVQTGPYRWSGLVVFNMDRADGGCGGDRLSPSRCEHPWLNEITGTISAPERPGFFDGRFSRNDQLHNANSWGVGIDQAPNFALSTMFYGFKRQDDGSFTEPFYLAFNDLNDGITGPFGLNFMDNQDGTYSTIFALGDAFTTDFGFDVYQYNATFEQNNNMGDYELSSVGNPPNRGSFYPSQLIDFGDNSGTQGNPFLYHDETGVRSIWTDDEYDSDADTHLLSVYHLNSGTYTSSDDWTKVLLPENVNRSMTEAIQPTFMGDGLFFTEDVNIAYASYTGEHSVSALQNNANWSLPETVLQKDTSITSLLVDEEDVGKIIAIGEPTVTERGGLTILYFVYAYIRGIDEITGVADLDFQAGFVEAL